MIIKDQLERSLTFQTSPKRIISCVPSITELLFSLIPAEHLVARTKFCIHPNTLIKDIPKIGGTKTLNLQKITALAPELIIANKEENVKKQIEELAQSFPTYISDIKTIQDTTALIKSLGNIFNELDKAERLVFDISQEVQTKAKPTSISSLYLIWKNPYMSIGADTYIHDILFHSGFRNVLEKQTRYPEVSIELVNSLQPEVILLSSEPFPFSEKHIVELKAKLNYPAKFFLVDGEYFSWYGVKTLPGLKYAKKLHASILKDISPS